MTKVLDIVLSYPKLKARLEGKANGGAENREKVKKMVEEIQAEFSETAIGMLKTFLDAAFGGLYDGVNYTVAVKQDFKKLLQENNVILVPNHQSHVDYLALNYMIYKTYKIPAFIAGGINLNIFPIGKLFRKTGCFFIRRSFNKDILYKLTLEAYLYSLMYEGRLIEFFFEGGRSRTGKLLPPRYGLYQMIMEAHNDLPQDKKKPLLFVPVSISHEYVPEQKSLARELKGGKKTKESTGQLLKIFKILSYRLGTIHIHLSEPVASEDFKNNDQKKWTQDLAFECYRMVGKNMMVTPSSLLSLILLDEPSGACKHEDILEHARSILKYCKRYSVPITESLFDKNLEATIKHALEMFISNKKIDMIGKADLGHVYYAIKEESRLEMLYFKNSILHHFIVPWIINSAWLNFFSGTMKDVSDLKRFFLTQRDKLKIEFYLPSVKDFFHQAIQIISDSIGRKIETLDDCMHLSNNELYELAAKLGVFSRALTFINEAYYLSSATILELSNQGVKEISKDDYLKNVKEIFKVELLQGKLVRYNESINKPLLDNSLNYLENQKVIVLHLGGFQITDPVKLGELVTQYQRSLKQQKSINMRANI
jgi:glycerol-3-phosphate O-acyltransferase